MHRLHELQRGWKDAIQWVEEHLRNAGCEAEKGAFRNARNLLDRIRWDEQTKIPGTDGNGTSTFSFAAYLSDDTLMNTDRINMMFSHLSDRAEEDLTTDSFVIIEQLRFMEALAKFSNQVAQKHRFLDQLGKRIKDGDVQAIVFPVHMPDQKHWLTMQIDIELREISYGVSILGVDTNVKLMFCLFKVTRFPIEECRHQKLL